MRVLERFRKFNKTQNKLICKMTRFILYSEINLKLFILSNIIIKISYFDSLQCTPQVTHR